MFCLIDAQQGGIDAPSGRFPYMVSIGPSDYRGHKCGGVLIHPLLILTAAHCVAEVGPNPIVRIGAYRADDDELVDGVQVR